MSESLDEVPLMVHKSAECADLGEGLWHGELLHCMYIFLAGMDPLVGNMMHEVYDL